MDNSKYLYPPFDKGTYEKLNEFPEFVDFIIKDKNKFIDYLILCYDRGSDLFILHSDNLYFRKKEAAKLVGFKLNSEKQYDDYIEGVLVGDNENFNLCYLRYVRLFGIPDLPVLLRYIEMLDREMSTKLPDKPKDREYVMNNIEKLRAKVEELEVRIFTGKETEAARETLYRLIERMRVPRPENVADDIANKKVTVPDPYKFQDGK